MAEAALYTFQLSEVTSTLIKAQGIKEGSWVVGFDFAVAAANAGPSPTEIKPSMILSVNNLTLVRVKEGEPVPPFAVDAAKVA
jgi:hypothetical protein